MLYNTHKDNKRAKSECSLLTYIFFFVFKSLLRCRCTVWVRINVRVRFWVRFRNGVRARIAVFLDVKAASAKNITLPINQNSLTYKIQSSTGKIFHFLSDCRRQQKRSHEKFINLCNLPNFLTLFDIVLASMVKPIN